jgi:branched-chain amino acid aminotransferase
LASEELGLGVVERAIDRSELYLADEIFFTGTAAGITFVASIDHRKIGSGAMGPVTRELSSLFARLTSGREPKYRHYLTATYASRRVGVA